MQNPITGDDLTTQQVEADVHQLRTVRRNARKAARSGNPAKRAHAVRVLVQVPAMIRRVYLDGGAA